jgi:hypothetical protein
MTDAAQPEPATREGAAAAGQRYAAAYAQHGESLLLRHSGLAGGRWRLVGAHDRIGFAVAAFKVERKLLKFGSLAIWTNGLINRFETHTVNG